MANSRQYSDVQEDWGSLEHLSSASASVPDFPLQARSRRRNLIAERQYHALARAIEGEIIPRLMLTHRVDARSGSAPVDEESALSSDEVARFADIAMDQPVEVGIAYLESMVARGVPPDTLLLEIIGPAARRLGELWTADRCTFTDVTVGLTRLQQMVCELSPLFQSELEPRQSARQALLLPCPGEQHTLGLLMVQEYFRRSGWHVHAEAPDGLTALTKLVKSELFDVVGFSASCEIHIDRLAAAIRAVRKQSKNRTIGIMVGGRLFNERPELVARVGADVTAEDGRDAILRLPALLGLAKSRC